ncbi:DNA repair protein RadC [candidate division FCPU426 bacterium]|nr:DNA repair protein RadC [candidate division FCPU426 bacterium]
MDDPISQWPANEKPRERLLCKGAAALSDAELVAILIGTGRKGVSAVQLARRLLSITGGISALGKCSPAKVIAETGMGPAKAARLLAAYELGRRREHGNNTRPLHIEGVDEAARLVHRHLRDASQEHILVLLLDNRHRLMGETVVSMGGFDQACVHPREVFRPAIDMGAAAVIVAHNHPGGDPQPSRADEAFTRRLAAAASLLGIRLLDHIIVSEGAYVSFAQKGYLATEKNNQNRA